MKKVLVIVSTQPADEASFHWHGLSEWLGRLLDNVDVTITALDQLVYVADGERSAIYHPTEGYDIADFDLVLLRKVGDAIEYGIAVAHYLHLKGVPFTDSYLLTEGRSKLACAFARQKHFRTPRTIYASQQHLAAAVKNSSLEFPLIMKADLGSKGNNNFLVQSFQHMDEILQSLPGVPMIIQEYIPNQGDYRFLVLGHKLRLVLLRKGKEGSHLNNTSQGGTATIIDLKDIPRHVIQIAEQAAKAERLEVAGVDLIQDTTTGEYYILEVNRAPQIATGLCNDEKMLAYSTMIAEYLATGKE